MKDEEKKTMEEGYVSFDPEELKNSTQEGDPNDEAYELLWEATCVSSHVSDIDKAARSTDEDNVYPTTAAEVDKMEELVNKATAALKEPNAEFTQRVGELREIIEWSRKRHWKLNWTIIVGVIISAFILACMIGGGQGNINEANARVAKVEAWEEVELVHFDNLDALLHSNISGCDTQYKYDSPTNWYHHELSSVAWNYAEAERHIADDKKALETEENETMIESHKRGIEIETERKEEAVERFEELKDLDYKGVKEIALEEAEDALSAAKSGAAFANFIIVAFIMLIPLYIFASRPHGYTISRYRREEKNLGKIQKIAMWLSGGMLAIEGGIGFWDIVTKWSDGSTTREDDGTGPVRLVIKVLLIAGATLVFCTISTLLMIYATITGLIRNYDWGKVKKQAIEAGKTAKAKYEEIRKEKK